MATLEPDGLGGWVWDHAASRVIPHLSAAGCLPYLTPDEITATTLRGTAKLELIRYLERHPQFANGILHGLHIDVGDHRRDFRSYRGSLGPGSLQIVIDEKTGNFYADVDLANPYQDVANWMWHAGEVVGALWRRIRRKNK